MKDAAATTSPTAEACITSKKRKAVEYEQSESEDDDAGEDQVVGFSAFERLATIVNENINTSNEQIRMLNAKIGELQRTHLADIQHLNETVRDLRDEVRDLEVALRSSGIQRPDEDVSDDDESVAPGQCSQWDLNFKILRDYRIAQGHVRVTPKEDQKLCTWIKNQKSKFASRQLSDRKIVKLDSLGIEWGKKFPPPRTWDDMYDELIDWKNEFGTCDVPINPARPTPLARWVGYQRKEFKRLKHGRSSLISTDQIGRLREVGFQWKGPTC